MYRLLSGESAPYNRRFVTNDIACTTASIVAAAIGIRNLDEISEDGKNLIKRIHLLLAMFNACQPGVFAISGWDIVGALPLPAEAVAHLMRDGDTRWIQRGAYDLVDLSPDVPQSSDGIPRARCLYGSLVEQLKDPDSFTSQLQHLLSVRKAYRISESIQIAIPHVIWKRRFLAALFAGGYGIKLDLR